jgi:ABC-type nitrate/sulfonate/bicarbonate transport system substrate-binding protein
MKQKAIVGIVVVAVLVIAGLASFVNRGGRSEVIRYGISPYQDLAMPKIAEGIDLYEKNGLNVELITVAWEDIIPSLASAGESIDVAIGSVNTLLPRARNINLEGGGDVVFYYPLWVFKGASLMMHGDSGMVGLPEMLEKHQGDRDRAVKETMAQLRGKVIAVPKGTTFDQMLLAGLKIAGMDPKKDVDIRYVKLNDAVYGFLNGDVDIVGTGVTQRTEVLRHGAKVFLDMESFSFAEITGLVTTRHYAERHQDELRKLVQIWFVGVNYLFEDIEDHSAYLRTYLDKEASTKYSLEEYKSALQYQEFPRSVEEAEKLFLEQSGKFYWKRAWDIINDFLISTGDIDQPIPYRYFLGDESGERAGTN